MQINRYPKMVVLQRFRAEKLWYPENEAKAIWVAEATKYAIFKNIAHSPKYREREETRFKKKIWEEGLDWDRYKIFKIAAKDGKPYVWWKTFTEADYQRQIYFKRGEEIWKKLEQWAKKIIEGTDIDLLKDEQKFFKYVWVPHRDDDILASE